MYLGNALNIINVLNNHLVFSLKLNGLQLHDFPNRYTKEKIHGSDN